MSEFKVDTAAVNSQTATYNEHLVLFEAERNHSKASVATIGTSITSLIASHQSSLGKVNSFKAKLTGLLATAKTELATLKASLKTAEANLAQAKKTQTAANIDATTFSASGPPDPGIRKLANASVALTTTKKAGLESDVTEKQADIDGLTDLIAKADVETSSTTAQLARALQILQQVNSYNSLDMVQLNVHFRGLNLVSKVKQFTSDVEANDANAEATLNSGLPDKNWFSTSEAKQLKTFFTDKSAGTVALLKKAKAEGNMLSEAIYAKANPGMPTVDQISGGSAQSQGSPKTVIPGPAPITGEIPTTKPPGKNVSSTRSKGSSTKRVAPPGSMGVGADGYVYPSLVGDGSYTVSTFGRIGDNSANAGGGLLQVGSGTARAFWTGLGSPFKQIATGAIGLDAHQMGRGAAQLQNFPQGAATVLDGALDTGAYTVRSFVGAVELVPAAGGDGIRAISHQLTSSAHALHEKLPGI
ncbi:MAG: hypothetical protein KBF89_08560 [Acidimicrobiia bacterium]|nr:hypothetical protein [Acidimicrobiia bacterium]